MKKLSLILTAIAVVMASLFLCLLLVDPCFWGQDPKGYSALMEIGANTLRYALDHGGHLPEKLKLLSGEEYVRRSNFDELAQSFAYFYRKETLYDIPPEKVMLMCAYKDGVLIYTYGGKGSYIKKNEFYKLGTAGLGE